MGAKNMAESWGVLAAILIFCFTITGGVIASTRGDISRVEAASIQSDKEHAEWGRDMLEQLQCDNAKVLRSLGNLSVNQKRTMRHLNLEYIVPDVVK
jgi:hypothetical protein